MFSVRIVVLALAALLLVPVTADAADWDFTLAPYLWFAGLEGDAATIPGLPSAPIDVSPSQAIEDTEAALMLVFEARKGRGGLFVDLIYTDVRSEEEFLPALGISVRSRSKSTLLSGAYEQRLIDSESGNFDLLGGARYWEVDSFLGFTGPLGLSGRNKEDWVDPFLGLKGRHRFGKSRFYISYIAVVGGFDVSSKLFYDLNVNLGYQWNKAIGTVVGYRLFDVDYDHSGFVWDVRQEGLGLGLTWSFGS
jgi:hypothetical protein